MSDPLPGEFQRFLPFVNFKHDQPSSSWPVVYGHLIDFAGSQGIRVIETRKLQRGTYGEYYPYLGVIYIQVLNITKMLPTLAHEIGHVITHKAGILRKYKFDEYLAEALGGAVMDLLAI